MIRRLAFVTLLLASTAVSAQQISKPEATPVPHDVPEARDIAYPGTIQLNVDATNTAQGIFQVKEVIPVDKPGKMTLLYPMWLPGNHSPRGQLEKVAGLKIYADGKQIPWLRDLVTVSAFHIDVPEGTKEITAEFQFLSATEPDQGRIVMTPAMLNLQWNSVSLYPAGYYVRDIPVQAKVKYPDGWTAVSGLPAKKQGDSYVYDATNYQILVDSPVFAGKYYHQYPLSPKVDLNVFGQDAKEVVATPEQIDAHKHLVEQAVKLFGAQHYDHYQFLLALSDRMGGIGLEHHRSSENNPGPGYFTKWDDGAGGRNILPHEFTHSWNGKFRRPAGLWTPDYNEPKRDWGLWVYEGQTQFWGYVLGNRSGLYSKQQTLDAYARIMAYYDNQPGRKWRPLIDTTNDPIIAHRMPIGWRNYQRSEDYYNEGLLIWMDVDATLRQLSGGKKSLDDFAKAFFGMRDGDYGELTYTMDDIVKTLNDIQPYDWRKFLTTKLYDVQPEAPLEGFTKNGYKLVYDDQPSALYKEREKNGSADLTIGLGLAVSSKGSVQAVIWDSPAFKAGMDTADTIVAVNGEKYSGKALKAAVTAAHDSKQPITLMVRKGDSYSTVKIDYTGGLRYPHLVKTGKGETGLDQLLAPK